MLKLCIAILCCQILPFTNMLSEPVLQCLLLKVVRCCYDESDSCPFILTILRESITLSLCVPVDAFGDVLEKSDLLPLLLNGQLFYNTSQ